MYLRRTSRIGPARSAPCYGRFADDASGVTIARPVLQGPLGAARAGSVRRAAGLPGALMALVRDLQVLDEDLQVTLPRSQPSRP